MNAAAAYCTAEISTIAAITAQTLLAAPGTELPGQRCEFKSAQAEEGIAESNYQLYITIVSFIFD